MTMFQKTIFGDSKAVGMFANRRAKQADLFPGLVPLKNDPPARQPLFGQASFLDAAQSKPETAPAVPVSASSLAAPALPEPVKAAEPIEPARIDNVAGIIDLFSIAKANGLQWPKIRLALPDGLPVVLSLVGSGNNAGKIRVTNGGKFGEPDNIFYGFIETNGRFSGKAIGIIELLHEFSANPAQVAAEYGKGTGECCFCARPLTNGKAGSVEVGYGPICAEKFGLPWTPNRKDYDMIVGAPVVQDDERRCSRCNRTTIFKDGICADCRGLGKPIKAKPCLDLVHIPRVVQANQIGLPAPKAMLALPSPVQAIESRDCPKCGELTTIMDGPSCVVCLAQEAGYLLPEPIEFAPIDPLACNPIIDEIASVECLLSEALEEREILKTQYQGSDRSAKLHTLRGRISKLRARIAKLKASVA